MTEGGEECSSSVTEEKGRPSLASPTKIHPLAADPKNLPGVYYEGRRFGGLVSWDISNEDSSGYLFVGIDLPVNISGSGPIHTLAEDRSVKTWKVLSISTDRYSTTQFIVKEIKSKEG